MTKRERLEGKHGTAYHEVYKLVATFGPGFIEALTADAAASILNAGSGDRKEISEYLRRVRA